MVLATSAPASPARCCAQRRACRAELRADRAARRPPASLRGSQGGTVYTDDKAPVEWLIDKSIVQYAADGD